MKTNIISCQIQTTIRIGVGPSFSQCTFVNYLYNLNKLFFKNKVANSQYKLSIEKNKPSVAKSASFAMSSAVVGATWSGFLPSVLIGHPNQP